MDFSWRKYTVLSFNCIQRLEANSWLSTNHQNQVTVAGGTEVFVVLTTVQDEEVNRQKEMKETHELLHIFPGLECPSPGWDGARLPPGPLLH